MCPDTTNRLLMIANPCAGRKRPSLQQFKDRLDQSVQIHVTQFAGHAEQLAYQASMDSCSAVIAVGGDGTIHEVLNGLLKNPENQTALGCLPAGTANDYAESLKDFGALNMPGKLVDVGVMQWESGRRYFANVAGIGLPGAVADRARRMKRLPARVRYTASLLTQLGYRFKTQAMTLRYDDGPTSESYSLMLSAALGKKEGSYPLHPEACLCDGLFEVLRLGRLRRRELAWHFPAMLRGIIPKSHSQIEHRRCSKLEVTSQSPIPIHLDGEDPLGNSKRPLHEFTLEVVPGAVRCYLVNSQRHTSDS